MENITLNKLALIIKKSGMTDNIGHYYGRGANLLDLNGGNLYRIYSQIKELDEEKATAFVMMVYGMQSLETTGFLRQLFAFASLNFDLNKMNKKANVEEEIDLISISSMFYASTNGKIDDTHIIKEDFMMYLPEDEIVKSGIKEYTNNQDYTQLVK